MYVYVMKLCNCIMMTSNHLNYDQDDNDINDGNHDDADDDNDK